MADDIYLGDFEVGGTTYTVTEEDYITLPEEFFNTAEVDDLINAAKHAAVQRQSQPGNRQVELLRGDYHFDQDPVDWEGHVLVFDGNNLAHRVRHTFELSYRQHDVSISYGCLSVMAATARKFNRVTSIIVCWDGGVPQYRYDKVPTYKQRDHSDEEDYQEFIRQVRELHSLLPQLGVYSLRRLKAEADDLIYHITRFIHPDYKKVIVTTDQDLLQCINRDTDVWQPIKEKLIHRDNFKEYAGVTLKDFLTYRCLVGDSSDGVPGCKGIGEKTALKLLEDYQSATMMLNVATGQSPTDIPMSPSVAEKLRTFGLTGFCNTMAAIRLDHDMCGVRGYLLDELRRDYHYDHVAINNYLKQWGFVSLMDNKFYDCFKPLTRPRLGYQPGDEVRMPRVLGKRDPVYVETVV